MVLLEFEHLDLGTTESKLPANTCGTVSWGRGFYILTDERGIMKRTWT